MEVLKEDEARMKQERKRSTNLRMKLSASLCRVLARIEELFEISDLVRKVGGSKIGGREIASRVGTTRRRCRESR